MGDVGITLCGSYIPVYRLDRSVIGKIWGRGSLGGERTVANNDEDCITMAVEAARNCLKGGEKGDVDGLYFATTSAPYIEKMNSSLISAAVDLGNQINTADFSNSLRAGTGALKAALDSVVSGSANNVMVVAADCRLGYPRSDQEQTFGDGAGALLISDKNVLATFEGSYSISSEMMDVWRNPEDTFVRTWEGRFILGEGYGNHMKEVIDGVFKKYNLGPKDIAKAVFPAPDARTHKKLAQQVGLDPATQVQDPLLSNIGHCGAAHPFLMLIKAIEEANPGDILLLGTYADGADAMIFKVTDAVKSEVKQRKLSDFIDNKLMLTSYARFLSYKGILEAVPGEPFRLFPSSTVTWRDRKSIIRCRGSQCQDCGTPTFPIQRICVHCNSKDNFKEIPISDLEGAVFTFTLDNLAGRSDDPVVVQTVAELGDDRVRFYGMMTDCVPSEVEVGMPVGMTFRRIYEGAGMHNYFWKCRPLKIGGDE